MHVFLVFSTSSLYLCCVFHYIKQAVVATFWSKKQHLSHSRNGCDINILELYLTTLYVVCNKRFCLYNNLQEI